MSDHFKPIYKIGHSLSCFLFQNILDCEAYGADFVPKTGPFLLACNHSSNLDPFLAGCFISRDIYFFARKTLFKPGFANWILRKFNSIPVDRDGGDVSALKKVLELLKQGEGVLIFPEGTRSPDGLIQTAKKGVGMMACRAQVPVVPVHIIGSFDVWGKGGKFPKFLPGHIRLVYGQPLNPKDYDPGQGDPDRYQKAADKILKTIVSLTCNNQSKSLEGPHKSNNPHNPRFL
jgi:1-acyl-sn-glycerol-3-phosphate acyltransferase